MHKLDEAVDKAGLPEREHMMKRRRKRRRGVSERGEGSRGALAVESVCIQEAWVTRRPVALEPSAHAVQLSSNRETGSRACVTA